MNPSLRIAATVAIALLIHLAAAPARAQSKAEVSAETSVADRPVMVHASTRLGHFLPMGGLEDEQSLADNAGGLTMFLLSVGVRVHQWVVDLVFGVGGASSEGEINAAIEEQGLDPSGFVNVLFGVEAMYQFQRGSSVSVIPWVGLGLAYEATSTGGEVDDATYSRSYSGLQVRPMVGVDFPLSGGFALGVALETGFGVYGDISESLDYADDVTTFDDESFHEDLGDISNSPGLHGWVGLTARAVILP